MRVAFLILFLSMLPIHAQDLAVQQQQLAQQQTEQQVQIQNQLTAQQNQQNIIDNAAQSALNNSRLPRPMLSMKTGTYPSTISVRLEDRRAPQVEIYYTTNDWTPTPLSKHYTGPITISQTTHLQAIAVLGVARSRVISAEYTLSATSTVAPNLVAAAKTTVSIVFTAPFPAKDARIGDPIPIALAEDLKADGLIVAKGSSVNGIVTHVNPAGWGGMPGSITFAVHSVASGSHTIFLKGTESLVGTPGADVPFHHGPNVTIPMGATLAAMVLPDTLAMASK